MIDETFNAIDENDDELFEHYAFTAVKGQSPLRIDKYLMNFIENATRNKIQAAAKNGSIYVNDIQVKSNYKVKPFDQIRVMFEHPPYENLLTPENIPLNIVYEDDELLVINKEAGMVVHPGHGNYSGTLINALIYHFENLPNNSSNRPGLVHRIDKDTSGLLVIAKTESTMTHLAKQFFDKSSEREYVAIVWGNMEHDEGVIEGHIGRHPKNRLQNTVFLGDDEDKGKPAVTHYKVIERLGYVTLVACKLETGRTHQIRVHLAHKKFPILNDSVYGPNATKAIEFSAAQRETLAQLQGQALMAYELGFQHPRTKENLHFQAEMPDWLKCLTSS